VVLSTSWQFAEVDHVTVGAGAQPLSGLGPAPGVLREQWRTVNLPAFEPTRPPEFHLVGGAVVVADGQGVVAFDASTGRKLWHYREPGRRLLVGVTGGEAAGVVVVASEDAADENANRLVGLDAGTGQLLWARHNPWRVGTDGMMLTVASGILPVLGADVHETSELTGLDVRTGQVAWVTGFDPCAIANLDRPGRSDGSLVLLHDCGFESRVQAFDPGSGRLVWTNTWPELVQVHRISVQERTVLVHAGRQLQLISPDGTITTLEIDPTDSGDPLGFYLPVDTSTGTNLIDVRTGETVAQEWPSYLHSRIPTLDSGNNLYMLNDHWRPVPALMMGDPSRDELTWMPRPGSETVDGYAIWTATAGERLLLARQHPDDPTRIRLFAYVSEPTDGPVELGGIPYADWPDPCGVRLDGATGVAEGQELEPMVLGRIEYPQRACRIVVASPGSSNQDAIHVRIIWVGASAGVVEDWFAGKPGPAGVEEVIDHGYYLTVRIGRVLLELTGHPYDRIDWQEVLEALVDQLDDY
jgi:hypothetical protein